MINPRNVLLFQKIQNIKFSQALPRRQGKVAFTFIGTGSAACPGFYFTGNTLLTRQDGKVKQGILVNDSKCTIKLERKKATAKATRVLKNIHDSFPQRTPFLILQENVLCEPISQTDTFILDVKIVICLLYITI